MRFTAEAGEAHRQCPIIDGERQKTAANIVRHGLDQQERL